MKPLQKTGSEAGSTRVALRQARRQLTVGVLGLILITSSAKECGG